MKVMYFEKKVYSPEIYWTSERTDYYKGFYVPSESVVLLTKHMDDFRDGKIELITSGNRVEQLETIINKDLDGYRRMLDDGISYSKERFFDINDAIVLSLIKNVRLYQDTRQDINNGVESITSTMESE